VNRALLPVSQNHDDKTWPELDRSLLRDGRRPPPSFPLSLLGNFWPDWVKRAAKGASAPLDYVVGSLLASASALIANARKPAAGATWEEPPILWIGLVGSPSAGKSPALDAAMHLVRHAEDQMSSGFEEDLRRNETEIASAKAHREEWERAVKAAISNGQEPPTLPPDAVCPEPLVRPRIRVSDCTTEKLAALSAGNERGLLLVRDELAGWIASFDRYSGSSGADRAFTIEMFGGREYIVDRMRTAAPLKVPHLSVSVIGGIQPDKLVAVISGPDDGLPSRFLWCWPDADIKFTLAREVPNYEEAKGAFSKLLNLRMGADQAGKPEPIKVPLELVAENVLEEFACKMQQAGNDASGPYAGSLGKARGHAMRLAAVIEYLWWSASDAPSEPTTISQKAMAAAVDLMTVYFLPMAAGAPGCRDPGGRERRSFRCEVSAQTRSDSIQLPRSSPKDQRICPGGAADGRCLRGSEDRRHDTAHPLPKIWPRSQGLRGQSGLV
jgi:hypothetical protein